jgi:hypothetical protein
MTYSMNHGALTMKDADGREIPLDRGDFQIGAVEVGPAKTPTGPAFGWLPVHHTFESQGVPAQFAPFDFEQHAPPLPFDVTFEQRRGRWLFRRCVVDSSRIDGDDLTVNWRAHVAPEWRRKAPARLRRLTAQRRMQAERKAARRRYPDADWTTGHCAVIGDPTTRTHIGEIV